MVAATDASGALLWRKQYAPFGAERSQGGDAPAPERLGYTGHVQDDSTGLTYMRARYYDPHIGRFLSPDPVRFHVQQPMSFNRYDYANNNPYRFVDPDGRYAEAVVEVISIGMGVYSLRNNLRDGNYGMAAVDAVTIVIDSAGLLIPGAPGVTSMAVQSGRTGANAVEAVADSATRTRKVEAITDASGPHTTWKSDPQTGEITRHETWTPNSQNPTGWDSVQSTDLRGTSHINKQTGETVPTPHTQGKGIPGGVRPADPSEIPTGSHYNY